MPKSQAEAGFTLIELLVALAVLSIGLVALLNVTGENVRAASLIHANVVGEIVAENQMVDAMLTFGALDIGTVSGAVDMAGETWAWERRVLPTPDGGMQRIEIRVTHEDGGRDRAFLTAFREVKR